MTDDRIQKIVVEMIDKHPAAPPVMLKMKRGLHELGMKPAMFGKNSDEWVYFSTKMAAAYLDWLYAAARLKEQRDGNMG